LLGWIDRCSCFRRRFRILLSQAFAVRLFASLRLASVNIIVTGMFCFVVTWGELQFT
jgi:hypothetical protein